MKRICVVCLVSLSVSGPLSAAKVYQCEEGGQTVFSGSPCAAGQTADDAVEYEAASSGWNGSSVMDQNQGMLDSYERRKARQTGRSARASADKRELGFSDRTRIRELEIQKQRLREDLDRVGAFGVGSYGKARAIGDEIRGLDRQIRDIYAYPTGR